MLLLINLSLGVSAGAADAGKSKISLCVACHGETGNSLAGSFPNLGGQGKAYLLKQLKEYGYEKLIGIEPSVNINKDVDGITFINEFVDRDFILDEKVDFIFSIAVFEHIEKISEILLFCRNNLSEKMLT